MAPWNDQGEWEEPTGPNRIVTCRTPGCVNENLEIEIGPGDDPVVCGPCENFMEVRKKEEGYEPPTPEPEPDPTEGTESTPGDSPSLEESQPAESVDLNEDVKEDFPL